MNWWRLASSSQHQRNWKLNGLMFSFIYKRISTDIISAYRRCKSLNSFQLNLELHWKTFNQYQRACFDECRFQRLSIHIMVFQQVQINVNVYWHISTIFQRVFQRSFNAGRKTVEQKKKSVFQRIHRSTNVNVFKSESSLMNQKKLKWTCIHMSDDCNDGSWFSFDQSIIYCMSLSILQEHASVSCSDGDSQFKDFYFAKTVIACS